MRGGWALRHSGQLSQSVGMSIGFLQGRSDRHVAGPADSASVCAAFCIDWQAVRRAERACCCPAKPVVIAILPPSAGRRVPTDLLLCWHHYRASRRALAAADALLVSIDGTPIADEEWPLAMLEPSHEGGMSLAPSSR